MLRNSTRWGFLLAALMLLFVSVKPAVAQGDYGGDIDYQQFYDELSPYGQWVDDPDYGYVWVPDAGDDFRPYYSNGYWAYTDYGNTWVSDYSWGWAPFHYGRWTYNNFYGWMWIPGNTWGPAWVSWRSGGGAYGWAPLGPGVSINIAIGGYNCPSYWWNFAPQQYIFNRNWNRYSYGPRYNNTYINQTTIINNTYIVNRNTYLGGPRRDDLRRAIGRDVRPLAVNSVQDPQRARVRGNSLNLYRPTVASSRGRVDMKPRDFRPAERPIRGNTPNSAAGFGSRQDDRGMQFDRNRGMTPGRQGVQQGDNPGFDRNQSRSDRFDRNSGRTDADAGPDRRNWNTRPQPADQPQPRGRRFDMDRAQQPQQPRFEQAPQQQPRGFDRSPAQPRFEQAPRQQPRGFDRPQMQPQERSFNQPRPEMQPQQRSFEQPRAMPQPQQAPGGFGGQRDGRIGR